MPTKRKIERDEEISSSDDDMSIAGKNYNTYSNFKSCCSYISRPGLLKVRHDKNLGCHKQ